MTINFLPFKYFVPISKSIYITGKTNRVNKVERISPPITTVASGFCTSPPAPVLIAIGINPSDGTSAVMSTALIFDLVA